MRFRRRHIYIAGAFVTLWFVFNMVYLTNLNDKSSPAHTENTEKIREKYRNSVDSNIIMQPEDTSSEEERNIKKSLIDRESENHRFEIRDFGPDPDLPDNAIYQPGVHDWNLREQDGNNENEDNGNPIFFPNAAGNGSELVIVKEIEIVQEIQSESEEDSPLDLIPPEPNVPLLRDADEDSNVERNPDFPDENRIVNRENFKKNADSPLDLLPPEPDVVLVESDSNVDVVKQSQSKALELADPRHEEDLLDSNLTPDEKKDILYGADRHSFNVSASNDLPSNRKVPEFRPRDCVDPSITHSSHNVSVIICFHNEALSTLIRTIHSVVARSPHGVLHEIILVDDASTFDYLQEKLVEELNVFNEPHIRLLRIKNRQGIARSRMIGVKRATGDVLVFLDSHCECADGWLPPLLDALARDSQKIVCPEVDIIDYNTFEYRGAAKGHHGVFDWNLQVVWRPLPYNEKIKRKYERDPIRTPVMLGGIFAVTRDYFLTIGQYDEGMMIWGGENVELSFRVWMCGGSIEILPCSRVGHVFRPVIPYGFPYGRAREIITRNNQRVAEIWMDEFKRFFYAQHPSLRQNHDILETTRQKVSQRKKMKCQDFLWYLQNVATDILVPPPSGEYFGQIKQISSGFCMEIIREKLYLLECVSNHPGQFFHITKDGLVQRGEDCLDTIGSTISLGLIKCTTETIRCKFDEAESLVCTLPAPLRGHTSLCFDAHHVSAPVKLQECSGDLSQSWHITHKFDLRRLHAHYVNFA